MSLVLLPGPGPPPTGNCATDIAGPPLSACCGDSGPVPSADGLATGLPLGGPSSRRAGLRQGNIRLRTATDQQENQHKHDWAETGDTEPVHSDTPPSR